ncbi:MAG TPA: primosomal protein N' [Bacteroidota bacterium]|nr:primosomal protein N' [Bacteroidota bacterium]
MTPGLYVDLAIPVALDKLFTYIVPREFHNAVKRGVRVLAPFGKRTVIGIVVDTSTTSQIAPKKLKSIHDILDTEPILSEELLSLSKWMAEYYFTPLGEVFKAILIRGATRAGKRIVKINIVDNDKINKAFRPDSKQSVIIKELSRRKSATITQLQKNIGIKSLYTSLNILAREGYVSIEEILPTTRLKSKSEKIITLDDLTKELLQTKIQALSVPPISKKIQPQIVALKTLQSIDENFISVAQFLRQTGISLSTIRTLARKGMIAISTREVIRSTDDDHGESYLSSQQITLNNDQQNAVQNIQKGIQSGSFQTFLLYGVTGSGKTQVYIEAIRDVLLRNKTAIVLVPEISLTPQAVHRFKYHFGEKVVAFHSRMSSGERYDAWRLACDGKYSIVIGPRSAIFAPLKNLGLIVVDEEQESSYKQFDQTPRYHARDVAIMRAYHNNAVVVLGSATPSFESYANAMNGKYTLLELPERVDNAKLPLVEIVDMAAERKRKLSLLKQEPSTEPTNTPAMMKPRKPELSSISDLLKNKIEDRLQKKEGIILLQNRRGYSTFIECPDCGNVEMCQNCHITLTYHATKKHLRCHYCGAVKAPPEICPKCKSADIKYQGFGTQRVEEELEKIFPSTKMIRMDLDTTTRRGSHSKILRNFAEGEVDILLGTQMVAKGLDFSRVTLVGVISADTQILLPDFRSSERTFQLLSQVAGRAGRSTLPGEVIIQTYQPHNSILKHVITHDYKSFYDEEIQYRKELNYPPFSRLILIEFRGKIENDVMRDATIFTDLLKNRNSHFLILGPSSAVISKIRGLYRWHIILKDLKSKDPSGKILHRVLTKTLEIFQRSPLRRRKAVKLVIDVDPVGMM